MKTLALRFLPRSWRDVGIALLMFAAYYVTAKLSLDVYYTFKTSPALIWPPVGIALAMVIVFGYSMWLPIFLAQFLVVFIERPGTFFIATVIAAGYAFQAVVGLYLLRRYNFEPDLGKLRNAIILVSVAILIAAIEPLIATPVQVLLGFLSVSPIVNFGRSWGASIFSMLVFTPFLISWFPWRKFSLTTSRIELSAAFAVLVIVDYFLFWTAYPQYFGISVIFFLPAVLIWFALRLQPRWMSLSLVFTSFFGIAGSIIAQPTPVPLNAQLLADEIYIGLVAAIFIIFVAVVEERRRTYLALEEAYQVTSAADKAKNEFIAILAHELRNPLAPIVSSLELLRFHPQTAEALQTIENAEQHTVMIRRLLDDLLDTARLSQKKFKLKKTDVVLRDIIEQSIASVRDLMRSRRHELRVVLPEREVMLHADSVRVKQIIINLLTNAGKYTEPGGCIELTCTIENECLAIRVKDNGIGLDMELVPSLFEPFKQAPPEGRASTGLGIGLYLTKQLTEMHGGSIDVESAGPGHGSIFTVHLPLSASSVPSVALIDSVPEAKSSRILIVDDNQAAASSLQKLLSYKGHEVQARFSGKDALAYVDAFRPDLILLDIGMEEMDGYEVVRRLRSVGWTGAVVALTGYGQETDQQLSREAGFDHHLVKPVGINDIVRILVDTRKHLVARVHEV